MVVIIPPFIYLVPFCAAPSASKPDDLLARHLANEAYLQRSQWRRPLPLTAVVTPAVLTLGPFEVERMPTRLIPCVGMN